MSGVIFGKNIRMQETWKIKLMELATDRSPDSEAWLRQVFQDRRAEIGIFLSYYYRSEGAVVENVSLQSHCAETVTEGNLIVRFDLVHYNACLNIHEQGKEAMELRYQIFPSQGEILLTGPYWPEREPDEM